MASNTDPIILKLELQEAQAKVNIKKLKQELDRLDGRTNEYKLSVKKLQVEEQKLVKIQGDRVTQNKVLSGSLGTLTKGMHGAGKAAGAATTSVLELGRIVMEGDSKELLEKEDIKEFYLGQKDEGVRGERRWKKKKMWR